MYFVYILLSHNKKKTYVGQTDNLEKRVNEHNSGKSTFTKRHMPWEVVYEKQFKTKREAIIKEKYFKSTTGRRWMKKYLFH